MSDLMDREFLPYTEEELRQHFVHEDHPEGKGDHLKHLRERIAKAPCKFAHGDQSWLERDETLWTVNALMAIQQHADCADRWQAIMAKLFGPVPPTTERLDWSDLLKPDLQLYFEVALPSPHDYRSWLSRHPDERQVLTTLRNEARSKVEALEGSTQLDALLLSQASRFALHLEAKVLADISTHIWYDSLRNQLARNIDCMAYAAKPPTSSVSAIRTAASS